MQAIPTPHTNVTYAENQPQYLPLPVFKQPDGTLLITWKLTWRERLTLLFTGRLYHIVLTFNQPLQPIMLLVKDPVTITPPTEN